MKTHHSSLEQELGITPEMAPLKTTEKRRLPEKRRSANYFPKVVYTREIAEQEKQAAAEFLHIIVSGKNLRKRA